MIVGVCYVWKFVLCLQSVRPLEASTGLRYTFALSPFVLPSVRLYFTTMHSRVLSILQYIPLFNTRVKFLFMQPYNYIMHAIISTFLYPNSIWEGQQSYLLHLDNIHASSPLLYHISKLHKTSCRPSFHNSTTTIPSIQSFLCSSTLRAIHSSCCLFNRTSTASRGTSPPPLPHATPGKPPPHQPT